MTVLVPRTAAAAAAASQACPADLSIVDALNAALVACAPGTGLPAPTFECKAISGTPVVRDSAGPFCGEQRALNEIVAEYKRTYSSNPPADEVAEAGEGEAEAEEVESEAD